MAPESKRPLDQYVRAQRAAASVFTMRAVETLVSGLALPAGLGLLGLVLVGLAWLDGYIVEAGWERASQRKTPRNRGRAGSARQPVELPGVEDQRVAVAE